MSNDVEWTVSFSNKAKKQLKKMNIQLQHIVKTLQVSLEKFGPIQTEWSHFSVLDKKKGIYHCWLKCGRPVFVAVWQIIDKKVHVIDITYVGTHEGAPY